MLSCYQNGNVTEDKASVDQTMNCGCSKTTPPNRTYLLDGNIHSLHKMQMYLLSLFRQAN